MNKERTKGFISGVLITVLVLGMSFTAFAATGNQTITAAYNNIKIYVDQKLITPKDANGNTVEPFIYNGTTYLPVRAVGEAFGKTVDWDNASKSVIIGQRPAELNQPSSYKLKSNQIDLIGKKLGEFPIKTEASDGIGLIVDLSNGTEYVFDEIRGDYITSSDICTGITTNPVVLFSNFSGPISMEDFLKNLGVSDYEVVTEDHYLMPCLRFEHLGLWWMIWLDDTSSPIKNDTLINIVSFKG